jgi:peptidoglycan hydrolase-like protein with peptidoglycan-binding domain
VRRRLLVAFAAVVVLGGAVAGVLLARAPAPRQPGARLPPATATVARTTLVETRTVSGTLGYGEAIPVSASEPGTLTWIAPVGSTVRRGDPLFKVDERPIVELSGSIPVYRALRVGVTGADVRQLEQNLADLGYGGFVVDDTYTAATAAAVATWHARLGLPASGTVEPGQVVITAGAVRIAEHRARVGDVLADGSRGGGVPVLACTDTTRLVTVDLEVADRPLAAEGRPVTVKVPGVGAVKGTISGIGTVATTAIEASPGPSRTPPAAADARIQVTVTLADQAALGSLDAAPVDVDLVSEERRDVLAVPVSALLALAQGGYGVEVVQGDRARVVPVKTGMFAAGRVEVSGEGIAEGVTVGVPK